MNSTVSFHGFASCPACQILKPALCCDGLVRTVWRDAPLRARLTICVVFVSRVENLTDACISRAKFRKDCLMSHPSAHPDDPHYVTRNSWLRAAVLGANDGIVSVSSLVVGVAAAEPDARVILVAGVAGLVAGAMSMAAGEYVSVSSQSDTERADIKREEVALRDMPAASLNVGLTAEEKFLCIIGFSGKIIDKNNLKLRIKNSTETLLIHGDIDQVVPSTHLLEAKDFLIRNNIEVQTLLIKDCDHHIPLEASSTALNYILKKI